MKALFDSSAHTIASSWLTKRIMRRRGILWLIDLRLANVTPESPVTPETQGFREAAVLR